LTEHILTKIGRLLFSEHPPRPVVE